MKGFTLLLWALVASVSALVPRLPAETYTPPCQACLRMHHRPVASKSRSPRPFPTPTTPPKPHTAPSSNCTASRYADVFTDFFHDNPGFCTIYERGWTITVTTDCKGCALETMTAPKQYCANTRNVTLRAPSIKIECATSTETVSATGTRPATSEATPT